MIDHVCRVESIGSGRGRGKSYAGLNVGAVVVGVRDSADLQQPSSGPGSISKILNYPGAVKVKVWGNDEANKARYEGKVAAKVREFLRGFPCESDDGRECIELRPFIPSAAYKQGARALTDPNHTSLVLALTYYDVKVLFPGDAPGEMHDCLDEDQQEFVKDVDVLIAPHHGSENDRCSSWYSSGRRFCTIISGDPSVRSWKIPGPGNHRVMDSSVKLASKRLVYAADTQGRVKELTSEFPVFCTWDREKKLVGYHIRINGNGSRDGGDKIKVSEIFFCQQKAKYSEQEIGIIRNR